MKFNEFVAMIYSYDTKGLTKSEFVIFLTNQIMEEPFTEADKQKELNDKYNPLASLTSNALEKIFNGSRNISKKHARIIRSHLDKDKFDTYITTFNNNAIDYFCETLKKAGISITDNQVSLACADTFEKILMDVANATSKQSSSSSIKRFVKDAANKNGNVSLKSIKHSNVKNDIPSEEDIPFEEIFNNAFNSIDVIGFIKSDPTESLSPHFFEDMRLFVGIIQQSYKRKTMPHMNENTSCKMIDFSKTLSEYVEYLEEQMKLVPTRFDDTNSFRTIYEPPKDNKDFRNRTIDYRNSLQALYNEIRPHLQEYHLFCGI